MNSRGLQKVACTAVFVMEYKITALKAQKRDPNRVNVYLDGKFAFAVQRIVGAWLSVGQMIDDKKVDNLKTQDTYEKAFLKAVRFVDYRPRTEQEVRKKLREQEFPEAVIEAVLERLNNLDFVGDAKYARFWIENRSTFRPRSHRMLVSELIGKGVSSEIIDEALQDAEDDESLAYKAATKYIRRVEGLDWENFRKKLSGFLARKGFSYSVTAQVVRQVWEETQLLESTSLDWETRT